MYCVLFNLVIETFKDEAIQKGISSKSALQKSKTLTCYRHIAKKPEAVWSLRLPHKFRLLNAVLLCAIASSLILGPEDFLCFLENTTTGLEIYLLYIILNFYDFSG